MRLKNCLKIRRSSPCLLQKCECVRNCIGRGGGGDGAVCRRCCANGLVLIAALIEDAPWCSVRVLFQSAGKNAVQLISLPSVEQRTSLIYSNVNTTLYFARLITYRASYSAKVLIRYAQSFFSETDIKAMLTATFVEIKTPSVA